MEEGGGGDALGRKIQEYSIDMMIERLISRVNQTRAMIAD